MHENNHNLPLATFWMMGTLLSFSMMAVAARELSQDFTTFQILALRSVIGLVVISLVLSRLGWHRLMLNDVKTHLMRNLSHFLGQFGWFFAIAYIPLAAVFAIEFTVPLWTMIFAALLLRERITLHRVLALGVGIIGVLIVLRPGWEVVHVASLAVLGGALAYGLSHTLTKKLAGRSNPLSILFFMMAMQLPLGLVPALFDWVTPQAHHWPWLLLVGLTGLSAHYCMVRALALADASLVIPMDLLRLPLIALIGYLVYNEQVDWYLGVGAGLIVMSNVMNLLWGKNRK